MILPSDLAHPTTTTTGYFEVPPLAFADWLVAGLGPPWTYRPCQSGTLDELVKLVRPRAPINRYLLMPNRGWTVLLDNGPTGTDVGVLPWQAARDLGCRSVRATGVRSGPARYPGTVLELFEPSVGPDRLYSRRTIVAVNDGGRWVFSETGEPFPFEDQQAYQRRLIRDRFTPDMLAQYLAELGVPARWAPDTTAALLVERSWMIWALAHHTRAAAWRALSRLTKGLTGSRASAD